MRDNVCKDLRQGRSFGTGEELKKGQCDWCIMRDRMKLNETQELCRKKKNRDFSC